MSKWLLAAAVSAGIIGSSPAAAQTTDINSLDSGWYKSDGTANPGSPNIITGGYLGFEYRSFVVFDLSLASHASDVSLSFYANNGRFVSPQGTETIALFDYSGSIPFLLAGAGGTGVFGDLGSGTQFGSFTLTAPSGSQMPLFTVDLSDDFLTLYNSLVGTPGSMLALGIASTSIDSLSNSGANQETFWSGSGYAPAAFLTATAGAVPEPGTWAMMLLGFGFVGGAMRTTKRRQRVTVSCV